MYDQSTKPAQTTITPAPIPHGIVQRACACGQHSGNGGECEACKKKRMNLQRQAASPAAPDVAPPIVHEVLRSPGRPLDAGTRAFMEPRFGRDFSGVRVHTDLRAAESARAVNALAYTVGSHIAFDTEQYQPSSAGGKGLLAHELAHVVQQGISPDTGQALAVGASESSYERQADAVTHSISTGKTPTLASSAMPQLMRATRTFSLTFDDGPHAAELGKGINLTENVLDILKAKDVKAGFFIQTGVSFRGGNKIGRALVARMAKDGHTVGIHTGGQKDHELHTKAEQDGRLTSELQAAEKYIEQQAGGPPTFVRPPKGIYNPAVEATYKKVGLTNLLWDIDGDQGMSLKLSELKQRLNSGVSTVAKRGWKGTTSVDPKIVVLYHDIQSGTAKNIGALIDEIKTLTSTISGGKDTASFDAP